MKKGDWVISALDPFELGQVLRTYEDTIAGEGTLVDIALYDPHDGAFIGRSSPPEGGPTRFEPACPATNWLVIHPPTFPMPRHQGFGSDYGSYRPYVRLR